MGKVGGITNFILANPVTHPAGGKIGIYNQFHACQYLPVVYLSITMKLKHFDHDGRARFITFCTHRRMPVLTNSSFQAIVARSIGNTRDKFGYKMIGYVLMPEHVHLVIIPDEGIEIGKIIGEIKRVSSKEIHKCLKLANSALIRKLTVVRNRVERFAFWQRRCYDHNCRTEKSLWEKVNYCHNNPVKRGLVNSPELWKWSSYRWYTGHHDVVLKMDIELES